MAQFNARIGERLRVGDQDFQIAGQVRKIPGESLAFSLINPRVYISLDSLDRSQLLLKGSLVRYRVLFKLDAGANVEAMVEKLAPQLEQLRLRADTPKRRAAVVGGAIENLSRYLSLAAFIAVLLAGVGIGSGVYVYTKEKGPAVAVLRCLGARPAETVALYAAQVFAHSR